jgi:hypothetical protein
MSPALVVSLHRRDAHGVAGKGEKKKRKPKAGETPEPIEAPRLSLVGALDSGRKRKGPPSLDDLNKALARIDGYVSTVAIGALVDADPRPLDEQTRGQLIEWMAPTTEECLSTWRPVARMFAGTELNKRYGRTVVDNVDAIDAVATVVERYRRISAYMRRRDVTTPAQLSAVPNASADPRLGPSAAATPENMQGVVVTPGMVPGSPNANVIDPEQPPPSEGATDAG